MNVVTINGYYGNGNITTTPTGRKCFKFFVITTVPNNKSATVIECRAYNELCDYCYAELSEGCYVEVIGQLDRYTKNHGMYVFVSSLVIQKPKARRQTQIRTTDFLQAYQPANVLKRLNEKAKKDGK